MTGYFTADALALAARGIERLIAAGGRMRLLVGCTLEPAEVQAITEGYDLRETIERRLVAEPLTPPDLTAQGGLEALAWLVAQDRLDVKVAVPTGPDGKPVAGLGLYHEKAGVVLDAAGNRISFSGSINETRGGWVNNRESFHVHVSWGESRDSAHVADEVEAFERLWTNRATSVTVFDFPDAAKQKLLEFLPDSDRFVTPPASETESRGNAGTPRVVEPHEEREVTDDRPGLSTDEQRRLVWTFIRHAAAMENGVGVGEATSAIRPWPHQVRAFKRLYDAWPCQMLIADEVGLGKTVTAGLLLRQAWLSGRARRILLLVPKAVMPQWQDELYEKFNLNVPRYDGQKLLWKETPGGQVPPVRKIDRDAWHTEPFVICSSQLMRRRDRAKELLQAEDWDLIVADEAHHARRRSPGSPQEGGPNNLLRLLHELRPKCRSLLLLTATPMQVHPVELWDLLNLLGLPPRWAAGKDGFLRYFDSAGGNPGQAEMEFLAGMFRETEAAFGPVSLQDVASVAEGLNRFGCGEVLKALRDAKTGIRLKRLNTRQWAGALQVLRRFSPVRHRMSRHTRSLLREYHRRGLIDSPIAVRDVRDIAVTMTTAERSLYDAVEEYIGTTYNNASKEKKSAVGFVMTIYRRRLASSFYALQRTLNNRSAKMQAAKMQAGMMQAAKMQAGMMQAGTPGEGPGIADEDLSDDEQRDEVMDADEADKLSYEALDFEERSSIQGLLEQIAKVGTNTKARRLCDELAAAERDGLPSAIVFTQYTDTMDWLRDHLAREMPGEPLACYSGRGGEVRSLSGDWDACPKEAIKRSLKEGKIRTLLCTDAAAEGLNFQSCGMLVNYDLPWNPMKVEQQIGRIDRIGQQHPTIRVVNLAYEDTVEADVYFALGKRIRLFEGLVGKLQPILSQLPKQFEMATLSDPGRRAATRQRLVADVELMTDEANAGSFDIDEVAKEALEPVILPPPSLTLDGLDRVMSRTALRPPQVEWRRLDPGSYAISAPGLPASVRVTTRAETFDDDFENHAFFGPGNLLFDRLTADLVDAPAPQRHVLADACVNPSQSGTDPVRWETTEKPPRAIDTLDDLLNLIDHGTAGASMSTPTGDSLSYGRTGSVEPPQAAR